MTGQLPIAKPAKLIVLMAFDVGEDGELGPAFEPREMPDQERAVRMAKDIASLHAGVITWVRDAKPDVGEFSEPTVLWQHGSIPDMD